MTALRPDEKRTNVVEEVEDEADVHLAQVEDEYNDDDGSDTGLAAASIGDNAAADVDGGSVVSSS